MNLSEHFTLEEFIATQHRGIDNRPSPLAFENLKILASVLEDVRLLLGVPILISSAYRCPDLNEAVGGSRNSRHMLGLAADFIAPSYGSPIKVCKVISESQIMYDQLILEFKRWVHFGLSENGVQPRRQVLTIINPSQGYLSGIVGEVE